MSFGAPGFLGVLALAPLVILLHMRQRETRKVASTRIWRLVAMSTQARPRPTPLRTSISLWLQLAFVTLAALALAEPRFANSAGTHHVLVLDAGLDAGRLEQDGKVTAYESSWQRWLAALPPSAGQDTYSAWWVGPWTRPVALELSTTSGLRRALEATTYSDAPPDWLAASSVLAAHDLGDSVVTVVAADVADAETSLRHLEPKSLAVEPLSAPGNKVELSELTVELIDPIAQRWAISALARVEVSEDSLPDSVTFRVTFLPDGASVSLPYAEREVRLTASGRARFATELVLPGAGIVEVAVRDLDPMPADGSRRFLLNPRPRRQTAEVITTLGAASPAARLLEATDRFDVITTDDTPTGDPVDLIVVERAPDPFAGDIPGAGAVLWVGSAPEAVAVESSGPALARVVRWDSDHPVVADTIWAEASGAGIVGLAPVGEVLVEGANGPLVTARATKAGREIVVTFDPVDRAFSESDAFVTLMVAAVDWLAPPETDVTACTVGQACRVPWQFVSSGFEARLDDGPVWRQPPPVGANVPSRLDEAWVPMRAGLWWLTTADGARHPYPVNPILETSARDPVQVDRPLASGSPLRVRGLAWALLTALSFLVIVEGVIEGRRPEGFWQRRGLSAPGAAGRRNRRIAALHALTVALLLAGALAAPFLLPRAATWTVLVVGNEAQPDPGLGDRDLPRTSEVRAADATGAIDLQRAMEEAAARVDPALGLEVVFTHGLDGSRGNTWNGVGQLLDRGAAVHVMSAQSTVMPLDVAAWDLLHVGTVFAGDEIDLTGIVHANEATPAMIRLLHGDEKLAEWSVDLPSGWSSFDTTARLAEEGTTTLRLEVSALEDTFTLNDVYESLLEVRSGPRVTIFARDGLGAQSFAEALKAQGFQVTVKEPHTVGSRPESFGGNDVVVLFDVAALELARSQQDALERWVMESGGGLAIVGGENSFGPGGYLETPIDALSPLSSRVSRDAPAVSMLFVLDRSGSMQQSVDGVTRLNIAKEATLAATELLGEGSEIAVIVFDEEARVLLPFTDSSSRGTIAAALGPLVPGGGTSLHPALVLAGDLLSVTDAASKHVVVMTDGLSQPGDFEGAVERLVGLDATVSAIAIGAGSDSERVKNIARIGRGAAHITNDFRALPSILAQEAMLMAGDPVVRERVVPVRTEASPSFMSGVPDRLPALHGLVETTPKAEATVLVEDELGRPVLGVWRYGTGRVLAFTSQGVGPWSSEWADLTESSDWWSTWLRWAVRGSRSPGVDVQAKLVADEIAVDVLATDDQGQPLTDLRLSAVATVVEPEPVDQNGEIGGVRLREIGPGRYVGRLAAVDGRIGVSVLDMDGLLEPSATALVSRSYASSMGIPGRTDPTLEGLVSLTGGQHLTPGSDWKPRADLSWSIVRAWRPWLTIALVLWTLFLIHRYAPGWLALTARLPRVATKDGFTGTAGAEPS